MSVLKLWIVVLSTVTVFDFALPFSCALWAKSIFDSSARNEIINQELNQNNIPENLRLSRAIKTMIANEPWSEMEIDVEDTFIEDPYNDSTFSFTDSFIIPTEFHNNKEKIEALIQAKILKGVKLINDYGFKEKNIADISYYTNKQTHQKFIKIVYTIHKDFVPITY